MCDAPKTIMVGLDSERVRCASEVKLLISVKISAKQNEVVRPMNPLLSIFRLLLEIRQRRVPLRVVLFGSRKCHTLH